MRTLPNPFRSVATCSHKDAPHVAVFHKSPGSFASFIQSNRDANAGTRHYADDMNNDRAFYGRDGFSETLEKLVTGDFEAGQQAKELSKQVKTAVVMPTARRRRKNTVAGGRPSVPAVLAGVPQCMRTKPRVADPTGPLTVVVNLTSSGGIDLNSLQKRGVAIGALVNALQTVRPVELHLAMTGHTGGITSLTFIRFPTSPLDVKRLTYIASSQSVARGMGFSAMCHAHTIGKEKNIIAQSERLNYGFVNWPFKDHDYCENIGSDIRTLFPKSDEFLYIPAVHIHSRDFQEIKKDAISWINRKIEQYS